MQKLTLFLLIFIFFIGCKSSKLPTEKFSQFEFPSPKYIFENDTLKINLQNPVNCPLRIWMKSQDEKLQVQFNKLNPIELKEKSDTLLVFPNTKTSNKIISFPYRLGSVSKKIRNIKIELPFPKNKKYRVIQGNNTNGTHNTDWSRYAVDFNLKINDTICSATNGFVVGVIDKYKLGGEGEKWKSFGNFITIYEPTSGIFTQYVHLVQNGSLVKIGEQVQRGQSIALSGKTGQTDIEHLHFNYLIPVNSNDGLKSIPFEFVEGYKSKDLKKNDLVKK
jgi:murein DD-endopeptidase MepM/ murein hydrolase activator NlpD